MSKLEQLKEKAKGLEAKDPKKAIDFYTHVVGWKTEPFKEGEDYVMWVGDQGPLGGVMRLPEEAANVHSLYERTLANQTVQWRSVIAYIVARTP